MVAPVSSLWMLRLRSSPRMGEYIVYDRFYHFADTRYVIAYLEAPIIAMLKGESRYLMHFCVILISMHRPSTTNIPAVVGIVLGVFALIVGGLAIGFFVRRRRMMSRGFSSSGYNEKGSADHSWARRFFFRRGQSQDLEKSHPSWQLPLQRPPISLPRPQEPPAAFVPVQIQRNAYNNPANMITVSSPVRIRVIFAVM
jgi:hypothetical protein